MKNIVAQKKVCTICNQEKFLDEFPVDKRSKSGRCARCLECNRKQSKEWRDKFPKKSKESAGKYRRDDPKRHKKMCDDWRAKNPERVKELAKENYHRHADAYRASARDNRRRAKILFPEKLNEYQRIWRAENKEAVKKADQRFAKRHPEKIKVKVENRRAMKIRNGGTVSIQEWNEIQDKFERRCLCCGKESVKLTMDHVIPLSKGGKHSIENIQPLCGSCNSKKGAKAIDFR